MVHAFENGFPNGFLGVDVFFVISGFVITGSLMAQKNLSLFNYLLKFYARRFARLMPALLLVVAFTTLAFSLVNPFPRDHLETAFFAIFGLANVNLYLAEQDYFAYGTSLNPFTHTWSLGIEEQFYLLIPVFLWIFIRKSNTALALGTLTVATLISFIAWVAVREWSESAAFYLIPFRFWELAVGVLAAMLLHYEKKNWSVLFAVFENRHIGSFFAALLGVTLFFPAEIPLIPATSVVIICTFCILLRDISGTLPGYLLTTKFVNVIGRSSYSIYLWHWPLIVLGLWTLGGGALTNAALVILSVIIGYLSYRYIENPIRNRFSLKGALAVGFWIACMGCVSLLPVSIVWIFPSLYLGQEVQMETVGIQTLTSPIDSEENGRWMGVECVLGSDADVGKVIDVSRCTLGRTASNGTRVLVGGNSYSASFVPAFEQLSNTTDTLFTITSSWAASPIDTVVNTGPLPETNEHYWSKVMPSLIADLKAGDTVLLISDFTALMPKTMSVEVLQMLEALKSGFSLLSSRLSKREISLVVVGPLPFVFDAKCTPTMAAPQWFAPNGAPCLYYTRSETERRQGPVLTVLAELEAAGLLKVVSLDSVFCPSDVCTHFGAGDVHLYRDVYAHPSGEAARLSVEKLREKLLIH